MRIVIVSVNRSTTLASFNTFEWMLHVKSYAWCPGFPAHGQQSTHKLEHSMNEDGYCEHSTGCSPLLHQLGLAPKRTALGCN